MARVRGIDFVWLLFLAALAAIGSTKPEHSSLEWAALLALGAVQIAEGHFGWTAATRYRALSIGVKFALCWLFIWETGGIESSYYLILFLPILSGASIFGLAGTLSTAAIAGGLYLSFLLFVLDGYYVPPDGQSELTVRVLFFFLMAILVNRLATENRRKTKSLTEAYNELSEAQAEVRRAERLAALGQLSAGLAHEMRNPLGVISASAELLSKHVSTENAVAREMAGFIGTEVRRTNSLVTRFLDFARPAAPRRELGDLNAAVRAAVKQLGDMPSDGLPPVEIEFDPRPIPAFAFDPTLIESSVFNLLLNGREAMSEGGRLAVSTARRGELAEIIVADTGEGIPADKLEDVFNPFFTTKPRGVGLGLAIVSKFIDNHGGSISVESEPGRGAKFRILLPLVPGESKKDA